MANLIQENHMEELVHAWNNEKKNYDLERYYAYPICLKM